MTGWIKLHRRLIDWEWYSDANTSRVFIHCLLKANHKDKSWKGKKVVRGTFISSFDRIAAELGLTRQKVRTAIANLKSTNDLTIESFTQHTVFKVNNYSEYQDETSESTNDQPTIQPTDNQRDNQQITTTKNDKKFKNEKNTPKSPEWLGDCLDAFWSAYLKKTDKKKSMERLTKMIIANPDKEFFGMVINRIREKAKIDTDKQFWPTLDRYLRDEKWTDELIDKGSSNGSQGARKLSLAERQQADAAAALAIIEAEEAGISPMGADGSVVPAQVGVFGGSDDGGCGLQRQLQIVGPQDGEYQ